MPALAVMQFNHWKFVKYSELPLWPLGSDVHLEFMLSREYDIENQSGLHLIHAAAGYICPILHTCSWIA